MMKPYVPVDPDLISAENEKSETPLHQACHRNGRDLLITAENEKSETPLHQACHQNGQEDLQVWDIGTWTPKSFGIIADSEEFSSLDDNIANESVRVEPSLALERCIRRLATFVLNWRPIIIRPIEFFSEPIELYSVLRLLRDKEGRTPLHLAEVIGRHNFLEEIILSVNNCELVDMIMKHGETVIHLAVKNNKIDVVIRYLMKYLHIIKLGSSTDNDGNTIIQLTKTAKLNEIITYLVTRRGTDVNVLNRHGLTPLGIVQSDNRNSAALDQLSSPHENPEHKNSSQSLLQSPEIQNTTITWDISGRSVENTLIIDMSPFNLLHSILDNHYHARHLDLQTEEELQNTRNRMIIAAVLIATLSFVAGINPPCAVHQEGMTSRNMTTTYMVFLLCNNVGFFSSLGITGTLFSTIHFSRTSMIKLLAVAYKIMWVSLSFTVAAYIAAAFMI